VKVNPITQVVYAVRGLLDGGATIPGSVGSHVGWTFVWIAGLLVVFFPLAMRAYVRRT
jgi:oleandomycin transport system permease protein